MLERIAPPESLPLTASGAWYAGSARRQWRLAGVLLIVSSLGAVDRQVITLLVNPIREALRISDVQISLIVGAAFALSNTLFTLPAGYFADRISRRGMIAGGALVWSVFTMVCGAVGSFTRLFLCRIAVGFGESVIQPCALSMIHAAFPRERRARGFAVQAMGAMGGSALALILGGFALGLIARSGIDQLPLLGHVQPWQLTLILMGVLGLPVPLLLFTVREPPREAEVRTAQAAGLKNALRLIGDRWQVFAPLIVFQLAMNLQSLGYAAWVAAMIGRTWHLSAAQIGTRVGLIMLVLPPIGLWTAGHLMDSAMIRQGVRGPVTVGLVATALVGVAATVAPLAPSLPWFWVSFAALCLVSGTVFPVNATVTASITPTESMGSLVGVQFFVTGLVAAGLGPTVVAAIGELLGGPRALALSLSLSSGIYGMIALAALAAVHHRIVRTGPALASRRSVADAAPPP